MSTQGSGRWLVGEYDLLLQLVETAGGDGDEALTALRRIGQLVDQVMQRQPQPQRVRMVSQRLRDLASQREFFDRVTQDLHTATEQIRRRSEKLAAAREATGVETIACMCELDEYLPRAQIARLMGRSRQRVTAILSGEHPSGCFCRRKG